MQESDAALRKPPKLRIVAMSSIFDRKIQQARRIPLCDGPVRSSTQSFEVKKSASDLLVTKKRPLVVVFNFNLVAVAFPFDFDFIATIVTVPAMMVVMPTTVRGIGHRIRISIADDWRDIYWTVHDNRCDVDRSHIDRGRHVNRSSVRVVAPAGI